MSFVLVMRNLYKLFIRSKVTYFTRIKQSRSIVFCKYFDYWLVTLSLEKITFGKITVKEKFKGIIFHINFPLILSIDYIKSSVFQ